MCKKMVPPSPCGEAKQFAKMRICLGGELVGVPSYPQQHAVPLVLWSAFWVGGDRPVSDLDGYSGPYSRAYPPPGQRCSMPAVPLVLWSPFWGGEACGFRQRAQLHLRNKSPVVANISLWKILVTPL